jgi:hypothetical protein
MMLVPNTRIAVQNLSMKALAMTDGTRQAVCSLAVLSKARLLV